MVRRAVVDGLPVLARVVPDLRLPRHAEATADRVRTLLDEHRIDHWALPLRRPTLVLRDRDRAAVLRRLRALGPAWYVEPLGASGARTGRITRVAASRLPARARGLALWECCVATAGSTFGAGAAQRVELHFWRELPDGALAGQVHNGLVDRARPEQLGRSGSVPAALAGRPLDRVDFPIDLVYTWVDGSDPAWRRDLTAAVAAADPARLTERATDPARFADHDELRYSLRSVEQFAPWVNHVWIVTAGGRPGWLRPDHPWITVVPHREIWPDGDGLPTFNSHAIEACLHRIPGLAEHYLYLNDDMFLGRPVPPELFFHGNGVGRLFRSRGTVDLDPPTAGEVASTTAAKNTRRLFLDRFGVAAGSKFLHTAVATRRSVMERLEAEFPDVFAATRRARFRTVTDVAAAGSFYLTYADLTGAAVPGSIRYEYVDPATAEGRGKLARLARARDADTFCINDGHTPDADPARTAAVIRDFLQRYLPVPGSFES